MSKQDMKQRPWIGVDLDGTLAAYGDWRGPEHIGAPLAPMVERVKEWLAQGIKVKVVTARLGPLPAPVLREYPDYYSRVRRAIRAWTYEVFGRSLESTATKDMLMVELWDDRARQVEYNTGRAIP